MPINQFQMLYRKAYILVIGLVWLLQAGGLAQEQKIADSLTRIYQQDTARGITKLKLLTDLAFNEVKDLAKALQYAEELISIAKQSGSDRYLRAGYFLKGTKCRLQGNLTEALQAFFNSAAIAGKTNDLKAEGEDYGAIADVYATANNFNSANHYYSKAIATLRQFRPRSQQDSISLASIISNAGDAYLNNQQYDSALIFFNEAKAMFDKVNYLSGKGYSRGNIGMAYAGLGQNDLAEENMNDAIRILQINQDFYPICVYLTAIADIYASKGNYKAALSYSLKSLQMAESQGLKKQIGDASLKLSELYEKDGNLRESFKYYKKHIAFRDSVNNIQNVQNMADLRTNYLVSQQEAEVARISRQRRDQRYLSIALGIILGLTVLTLALLLRHNRHKRNAYEILNLQKQETEKQKAKAEDALAELQVTQRQLIQAAKMASLGQLTAGIAHEIQNPLNFVTNFSEVSVELLAELRLEVLNKLPANEQAVANQMFKNIEDNLCKIVDHGKKADSIVKGMLQHSRKSSGSHEPTDFNTLVEEYLRLSHGALRSRDKTFDARFISNLDSTIGKIDLVSQDIGRVLLNLYNNAFYAVNKKRQAMKTPFEPLVTVTTKRKGNTVELSVRDNGDGVPAQLLDKIFQPFFTTKPTGQGTGLGLSLSYDIIKAHGGELNVETKEGEFAEFIMRLPIDLKHKSHPVEDEQVIEGSHL